MIPTQLALRLAYPDADDKALFEDVAEWHDGECRTAKSIGHMENSDYCRSLNEEIARLKAQIEEMQTATETASASA